MKTKRKVNRGGGMNKKTPCASCGNLIIQYIQFDVFDGETVHMYGRAEDSKMSFSGPRRIDYARELTSTRLWRRNWRRRSTPRCAP